MPSLMEIRNKSGKTLLAGVMDTEEMDREDRKREREMDIAPFIKLTARSALDMVKDPEDSGRTTKRVKILLELLNHETKGVYRGPVIAVDCQP